MQNSYQYYQNLSQSLAPLIASNASVQQRQNCIANFLNNNNTTLDNTDETGRTIVAQAVAEGVPQLLQDLLDCGANAQWRDPNGNTLLHYAVEATLSPSNTPQNFSEIFQVLRNNGVEFSDKNAAGETPVFALWWMLNDPSGPPLAGFALNFVTNRISEVLDVIATHTENIFEKNNAGKSFLGHTPVDVHLANHPDYIVMENMLQKYKFLEQAQTIQKQLDSANSLHGKKAKI